MGALHGLGGQGKTALAVQYAYAYAGHYAAGGRWLLHCEGAIHLAEALKPLVALAGLSVEDPPKGMTETDERAFMVNQIVAALKRRAAERVPMLIQNLAANPARQSPDSVTPKIDPHVLLILDNVDQPALMSASERAVLPEAHWLQILVTTQLDPAAFGMDRALRSIAVDDLPHDDAIALLQRARPFMSTDDSAAAATIVSLFERIHAGDRVSRSLPCRA